MLEKDFMQVTNLSLGLRIEGPDTRMPTKPEAQLWRSLLERIRNYCTLRQTQH